MLVVDIERKSRIWGFFAFVNVLWLVGLLGSVWLAATLCFGSSRSDLRLPRTVATIVPLITLTLRALNIELGGFVARVANAIVANAGLLEPLLYAAAVMFFVDGLRWPLRNKASHTGFFLSLTASLASLPLCWLSIFTHWFVFAHQERCFLLDL